MVKALISEDRDSLKRLRKKGRTLKRDLEVLRENEVLPTLRTLPRNSQTAASLSSASPKSR
jgi:hypothetical protein